MVRVLRSHGRRLAEGFPNWIQLPTEIQDMIIEQYIKDTLREPKTLERTPFGWRQRHNSPSTKAFYRELATDIRYVKQFNHHFKLHLASRQLAFRV